jgi:hypothetical protein
MLMYLEVYANVFRSLCISPLLPEDQGTTSVSAGYKHETELSLIAAIKNLCITKLNITISDQDISMVHRLQTFKDAPSGPVIVNFTSRRIRNEIYYARRLLRFSPPASQNTGNSKDLIYINEHLTQATSRVYAAARKLIKTKHLASAWTNAGVVYVKKSTDPTETPRKILTSEALESYIE